MELYVVLATSVLVWGGLFFYMVSLDRKITRLEEQDSRRGE